MPELPEVEAVCRLLRRDALGACLRSCHIERPAMVAPQDPAEILKRCRGTEIRNILRTGKNILIELSGHWMLRVHLGMTGNLYVIPDARLRPHTCRVWLPFSDGRALVLDDPRAFGKLHLHHSAEIDTILAHLGPDALSPAFSLDYLQRAVTRSQAPAKLFLLDQSRVAGLGNIWAAEALFRARIHPACLINSLSRRRVAILHRAIGDLLSDAIQSSMLSYSHPANFSTEEMATLSVYGRAGQSCRRCRRSIQRIVQGGRSTYFCPRCQR